MDLHLDDLVTLHRLDQVPDGAAYELQQLARLLEGATGDTQATLTSLARREAERILRRKQPLHGAAPAIDAQVLPRLLAALDEIGVGALAERLIVARLLAEALSQATPATPATPAATPAEAPR